VKRHRVAIAGSLLAATIAGLVAVATQSHAAIGLATPIVVTTNAVACVSFQCNWGAGTDLGPVNCYINYQPVDTNGNFIQGAQAGVAGPLSAGALNAFVTTAGNARVRCQASLITQNAALAGDAQ
jgi:hypothetical protein